MKQSITLIFLFLFTNSTFAANLCDASCNLTITFPDGGSITAVEPLTITFGDGGLVDTVAAIMPYVNGNTLTLGAGEALTFEAGGSFNLGMAGNIDYTNVAIETTGLITMAAVGGAETITFLDVNISGGTVVLNSDTTVEIGLTLSGDITISGSASLTNMGTINVIVGTTTLETNLDSSGATITSGSGTLTVSPPGSLTISGGQIVVDSTLSVVELNNLSSSINISGLITLLTEITIDSVLYTSDDGLLFVSPDGTTGSLDFANGAFTFVPDEAPAPVVVQAPAADSGATGIALMLMIVLLVPMMRLYQNKFFRIL